MSPERALKIYKPLKLHFTSKYDVFEAKNKVYISDDEYVKRAPSMMKYSKIFTDELEAGFFLVSNYIEGRFDVPFHITDEDLETFIKWKGRRQSITRVFKNEWQLTDDYSFNGKLFKFYLAKKVSPETVVLLDKYVHSFLDDWLKQCTNTVFDDIIFRLHKYKRFVKHDQTKILSVINTSNE